MVRGNEVRGWFYSTPRTPQPRTSDQLMNNLKIKYYEKSFFPATCVSLDVHRDGTKQKRSHILRKLSLHLVRSCD